MTNSPSPENKLHAETTSPTMQAESPEAVQHQPRAAVTFLGMPLPQPMSDGVHWFKDKVSNLRRASIQAAPAVVVNNSSNVVAAIHTTGEVMMFKASSADPLVKDTKSIKSWLLDPPKAIFENIFVKASKSLKRILNRDFLERLRDLEGATLHDQNLHLDRVSKEIDVLKAGSALSDKADQVNALKASLSSDATALRKTISLGNDFQTLATGFGFTGWFVNLLLPDRKDKDEEVEKMATMASQSPLQYMALRVKQALWPGDWPDHKRQMTGLAVMLAGMCSAIGSLRNRQTEFVALEHVAHDFEENLKTHATPEALATLRKQAVKVLEGQAKKDPSKAKLLQAIQEGSNAFVKTHRYQFNLGYLMTGLVSFASSMPLLFAVDNDRGYSNFGGIHLLRIGFIIPSLRKKWANNEQGREWYTGGFSMFQTENAVAAVIGGAEKGKNGEIIDHKAASRAARKEAGMHKDIHTETPATTIASPKQVESALAPTDHEKGLISA